MLELLRKTAAAHGVSGYEKSAVNVIKAEIEKYTDEQYTDSMGSLIAVRHGAGGGRKIMLCAHVDEIGYMVNFIDEKGWLRVSPIGGIRFPDLTYSRVISEKGVRGIVAPEGRLKHDEMIADKCYIDIGAKDRKEAAKKVRIGDVFRFDNDIVRLCGKRVCGHPLDDRIGCAVVIRIAELLKDAKLKDDVYFVFAVQEEVGLRGSKTAAFGIAPDIALAYDVTGIGDTPNAAPMACEVGGGAAIKVKDSSVICDPAIVDALIDTAKKNGIKYQLEVLTYGGTDTASMQMAGSGCHACGISIPTRYIHAFNEVADLGDAEACAELTAKYLEGINA